MLKSSMRKSLIALTAFGLFAPAQAADPTAPAGNLKGNAVVLRTLDKVTATTEDYTVRIGDELKYGSLTVVSGWMMASNPAISALDHSVYDIWVIDCKVPLVQGLR